MIRKILEARNPVLRQKSKTVAKIDKKVLKLIADLKDTLATQKDPEGVGLAAVQIGKPLKVFVASYGNFKRVVINPRIINKGKAKSVKKTRQGHEIMEGCLSLPNYYGPLKRSQSVRISYLNEKSEKVTETFKGFHAQIILHEIDHLKGVLFVDGLIKQRESLYKLKGDEWEEVEI
ncbi:peptide deformylase [Patescibacteria group bacterium]